MKVIARKENPKMAKATALLKRHWGHDALRPDQVKALTHIFNGKDSVVVLATGIGKSALFQLPPLVSEGCTLVFSPLIALMKDQVSDCERRGLKASYVNSHVTDKEAKVRLQGLVNGEYSIFYVAPERIPNAEFQKAIKRTKLCLIAVDEAHSISLLGGAFRPAYARIKDLLPLIKNRPPVLACTATATTEIVADIAKGVGMKSDYKRVIGDPVRPNLKLRVTKGPGFQLLTDCFESWNKKYNGDGRFIVYVGTQKETLEVAGHYARFTGKHFNEQLLGTEELGVGIYHGGMKKPEREKMQDAFKSGKLKMMVATCAFGMGIDVPNIRGIAQLGVPGTLEDFSQQLGRAGRDGLESDVPLLHDESKVRLRRWFIDIANPGYHVYKLLWAFMQKNLGPGELLTETDWSIAQRLTTRQLTINPGDVGAALSTMNSHSLIQRNPIPWGSALEAETGSLRDVVNGKTPVPEQLRDIAVAVWKTHVASLPDPLPPVLSFGLDRGAVMEAAGMGRPRLDRLLNELVAKTGCTIQPVDYSRTVQLLKFGVPLEQVLPESIIVSKRRRDEDRLAAMLKYASLKEGEHAIFLREYFLKMEK